MGNMSYCRHENTASDLADVWDRWEDAEMEDLSTSEQSARKRIIEMVQQLHEQF